MPFGALLMDFVGFKGVKDKLGIYWVIPSFLLL